MVLVCNDPCEADKLLAELQWKISAVSLARLNRMRGHPNPESVAKLHEDPSFIQSAQEVANIGISTG